MLALETKTMSSSSFGLSNAYLRIGTSLVIAALVAITVTSFFLPDREFQEVVRNIGSVVLFLGVVIYVIGRFLKAMHGRAQA